MRLASHKRFLPSRHGSSALCEEDRRPFFVCNCTYTPHFQLLRGRRIFFVLLSPICFSCGVKDFFCSLTHRWQFYGCSTFPKVALSMKTLPTLRLTSSKSSIRNNDSHMVRFLQSSKLWCPDAKPQRYLLFASA